MYSHRQASDLSSTYGPMVATIAESFQILDVELDVDQLADIVKHGIAQGVSGFIYYSELVPTYDLFEDEILTFLNAECDMINGKSAIEYVVSQNRDIGSMTQLKSQLVWLYVELKAYAILSMIQHPSVV